MIFARAKKSHCWQVLMEVGVDIPALKFLKIYPLDYPKGVSCLL
jgi:hypothetical protein